MRLMSVASLAPTRPEPATVQEHQRALGVEAAQLDVGFAEAAAVVHCRVGGGAGNRRESLQQVTGSLNARLFDGGLVDGDDGAGRLGVHASDT